MNLGNIRNKLEALAQTRDDKTVEFTVDPFAVKRAWKKFKKWRKRRKRK